MKHTPIPHDFENAVDTYGCYANHPYKPQGTIMVHHFPPSSLNRSSIYGESDGKQFYRAHDHTCSKSDSLMTHRLPISFLQFRIILRYPTVIVLHGQPALDTERLVSHLSKKKL